MKRYVCWLALLAVCAVPDWASAFNRRYWCGPVYPAYYEPLYYAPPPPVYYAPPCVPVYVAVPCPPATPAPSAKAATRTPAKPADPPKPMPETVRPAGGVTPFNPTPESPGTIVPGPAVVPPPAPPKLEIPKFEPKAPDLTIPPLPTAPASPAPAGGGLTLPGAAVPDPSPLIPSPVPPLSPEPKKTETLPPLVLPPETPVKPSTSRSSPIGKLTVNVFEASGAGAQPADGLKKVVFFNHTDRDLDLTVEGKAVKLPAKSYVNAKLGATFRWKHGDNDAETATIPADAAGLDVVFKE